MPESTFDLLIVGSGAAGLSAALRAADLGARVAVLTAGPLLAGSSPRAQGGVAAALAEDDTPALHAQDTLQVGGGLNDPSAVEVLTRFGRDSVRQLRASGVAFADDLGLEAGHARRRISHAGGGATGRVLTETLLRRAQGSPPITLLAHSPVCSLITRAGCVVGARTPAGERTARAVVLATGGYAALWARTTNAPETRGTGLMLAYDAGASLADLEFVQFHPTALSLEGAPALLLSEALRGEGARLVDADGHDLVDPLLPRDVLARALHRQLAAGRQPYLSLRHLAPAHVYAHFSSLAALIKDASGLDLATDLLPVAPAAHYCMGGIRTDVWGRTDVPGLYAAGEAACSGAQGANRLASNSLLECLVFGARTAEAALTDPPNTAATWATRPVPTTEFSFSSEKTPSSEVCFSLEKNVGVRRASPARPTAVGERLDTALAVERSAPALRQLITDLRAESHCLPLLIAQAALLRTESRGAHYRTDAPEPDPAWRGRLHWRRGQPPVFEEVSA